MRQKKDTLGMTLTSVLVAVALTSALAVATAKLISNQVKLNKIMTLTDQRDMIVRFYSALMHNRLVWRCTLYDPSNSALLDFISNTTNSFSGNVEMRTPDCKFKENFSGGGVAELVQFQATETHGSGDHYRSSGAFFDTNNPSILRDSLTEHYDDGWWEVSLTASAIAKGSVDLTLTVQFDKDKYKTKHAQFDPPDIRDTVVYKVRKGDPNIKGIESRCHDNNKAIIAIDDLRSDRGVTCSNDFLVDVQRIGASASGNFLHTLADGADANARVGRASGTEDRTGLLVANEYPFAIHNITAQGDYRYTNVSGARGVLGSHCTEKNSVDSDYVLHSIAGSPGTLNYGCSYNRGPRGKQGLPGALGHEGDQGERGDPAPACS